MSSYTDIFGGSTVQPSVVSYIRYNIVADLQLVWPSSFQDTPNLVSRIIDVNPTVPGLSVILPDARDVSVGQDILFNNIGANQFAVRDNTGTLILLINPAPLIPPFSTTWYIFLTDNTTQGGIWRTIPFAGGTSAVTSVNAVSANPANLTIVGGPIVNAGTFTFNFAGDLAAILAVAPTGILVREGVATWGTRTITAGVNINLTNGDGVAGNPLVALNANLVGLNSAQIGNINIAANTVSVTNLNGSLFLSANGALGKISLDSNTDIRAGNELHFYEPNDINYMGLKAANGSTNITWNLPLADGAPGQAIITDGAGTFSFATVASVPLATTDNAIARFNGIAGAIQNSGVIISDTNDITGVINLTATQFNVANMSIVGSTISTNGGQQLILLPSVGQPVKISNAGGVASALAFYNAASTQFVGFRVDPALGVSTNYRWPLNDGAVGAGQVMSTNGAGLLSFRDVQELSLWASFTGAGATLTAFGCAIVRDGVGLYTVTPTIPFTTANYVITATVNGVNAAGAGTDTYLVNYFAQANNSFRLKVQNFAGVLADATSISVQAIGN